MTTTCIQSKDRLVCGDFPGHPFRGNQFAGGSSEGRHHKASHAANEASKGADDKASHHAAADAHFEAGQKQEGKGNTAAATYHYTMAAMHHGAAGKH